MFVFSLHRAANLDRKAHCEDQFLLVTTGINTGIIPY